jgi:hypothetical protein
MFALETLLACKCFDGVWNSSTSDRLEQCPFETYVLRSDSISTHSSSTRASVPLVIWDASTVVLYSGLFSCNGLKTYQKMLLLKLNSFRLILFVVMFDLGRIHVRVLITLWTQQLPNCCHINAQVTCLYNHCESRIVYSVNCRVQSESSKMFQQETRVHQPIVR